MANEFIIKNGFHSKGDSQITGSLNVKDSLTVNGSAVGSAFPFTGDAQITGSLIISGSGGAKFIVDDALNIHTGVLYGLGRGVVALNNTNHTNILVGNDISGKGAYGSVVVGTSATVSNSHHSQVVIGRSTNSTATSTVIIGNAAEANDSYGISIGDNAGNTSNTKGINIGGNAKGKGAKGIVISSLGSINISPTKANTFGVYTHGTQPVLEIEATGSSLLTGSSFTIEKSGSTVFNVIGSEGDLFTITDSLTSGSLFAVKDISGFPLLDVTKKHDGTPDLVTVGQSDLILDSGSIQVTGSVNISNSLTVNGSAVGS